jgi:hypothetical protein
MRFSILPGLRQAGRQCWPSRWRPAAAKWCGGDNAPRRWPAGLFGPRSWSSPLTSTSLFSTRHDATLARNADLQTAVQLGPTPSSTPTYTTLYPPLPTTTTRTLPHRNHAHQHVPARPVTPGSRRPPDASHGTAWHGICHMAANLPSRAQHHAKHRAYVRALCASELPPWRPLGLTRLCDISRLLTPDVG